MSKGDTLTQLLDRGLNIAQSMGEREDLGGMASIGIVWNPYEGLWEARADWSTATRITATGADPTDAVMALIDLLTEDNKCVPSKPGDQ